MREQLAKLSLLITAVAICLAVGVFVTNRSDEPIAVDQEATAEVLAASEQIDDPEDGFVEPDVNSQQFQLASSNVSCPSVTAPDGSVSRSCNGSIRVVPDGQADMEPGLYKVDTQTRLLHEGVEQNLESLPRLVEANTVVRLQLAEGSAGVLATITY